MIDTFLLTLELLFKAPVLAISFAFVSFIVLYFILSRNIMNFLRVGVVAAYLFTIFSIYTTASSELNLEDINIISNLECVSSHYDVNYKFKTFYNENDTALTMVEAKHIFLELDNCFKENNTSA